MYMNAHDDTGNATDARHRYEMLSRAREILVGGSTSRGKSRVVAMSRVQLSPLS